MANASESAGKTETEERQRRAKQAAIVAGLQAALEADEQLLAFARGKISGGWRGKFAIGLEAFFAPDVNVGLTERHFILQHIHAITGTPSDILPHKFPLAEIAAITFGDIETFGNEPAGRLVMRLQDDQHFRVKLVGALNCEDAASLAEVFRSLTQARRKSGLSPTQSVCPHCGHVLDRPTKFCPYCGKTTQPDAPAADFHAETVPPETAPTAAASNAPDAPVPAAQTTAETPAPDFAEAELAATPFSAFVAPDLSEPHETLPPIVDESAEPAAAPVPLPAPDSAAGNFVLEDEAGEDLLPNLPAFAAPEETKPVTQSAPTPNPDSGSPTIELELSALDEIAETQGTENRTEDADAIQNPKSKIQNEETTPSAASTAFWREFARISGVPTPEVFAPKSDMEGTKTETQAGEAAQNEAERPAFPLTEEEN